MSRFTRPGAPSAAIALMVVLAALAGCSSSKKTAIYDHENFDDEGTYSRTYPVTDIASCEAARRALLSQGYIITSSDPKLVSGHKSFQQTGDTHMEISFNVVCATDNAHGATMFANALQDRYALKKTNNSASLGVGVLGSVSMPIGSTDDSMVKVASETVTSDKFYDRYFALVEMFLPKDAKPKAKTGAGDKSKDALGVPEPSEHKPGAPGAGGAVPGAAAPAPVGSTSVVPVAPAAVAPAAVTPAAVAPTPAAAPASPAAPSVAGSEPSKAPAAAEPLTTPAPAVVPVAPAVPAQLEPVDETVQSQPLVPPAETDAPIAAPPVSTP